jgi:hypothetical protein
MYARKKATLKITSALRPAGVREKSSDAPDRFSPEPWGIYWDLTAA